MKTVMKVFAILLAMVMIAAITPLAADADFGDFSGDGDYGGDSGGYDGGYDYDYDSDYGGGGFMPFPIMGGGSGFIVFMVIIFIIFFVIRSKGKGNSAPRAPGATPTTGLSPVDLLRQGDPAFSEDEIKVRLSNLYVQMQNCWTAKDLTPLQGDFTEEQYAQYDRQLQAYRDNGQTNYTERIAVLDVTIMGAKQDDVHDILIANVTARIVSYTVDDKTGAQISGDRNKEKFMVYEYTLVRPKGSKTVAENSNTAFNCPNCGAAININKSAKCPYCDSVITKADYDWVISGIKGISQRTS